MHEKSRVINNYASNEKPAPGCGIWRQSLQSFLYGFYFTFVCETYRLGELFTMHFYTTAL